MCCSDTGESKSQPLELGLKNGYDGSKRKSTAERTIMPDSRQSRSDLQARSPPTKLLDLAQTYGRTSYPETFYPYAVKFYRRSLHVQN